MKCVYINCDSFVTGMQCIPVTMYVIIHATIYDIYYM